MHGAARRGERHQRTIDALKKRSPRLAGMYRSAIDAMITAPSEGLESARVSVICHCMRELMNGLPSVMANDSIPRPKPSSGSLLTKLVQEIAAYPRLDLTLDQDLVRIPSTVATIINQLVAAVTIERGRNRSIAASLITGGADAKHPAVNQWREAQDFFLGWAHLDRNYEQQSELPSDSELWSNIEVVEDVIAVRSALFFDNLHVLKDLLAQANATDDGVEL